MAYDPALRLYQVAGASTTRFAYDGANAIAEYDGSNALQRRFVFGPGVDEPIVQYEGSSTTDRRFMSSDERGSVISLTDSAGALLTINRYDEYGKPQSTNSGRFQYTGQKWIGEANLYDYKARDYLPQLGIFAQTDPVGYAAGANLYAYVLNDPVNGTDPLGLCAGVGEVWVKTGGGIKTNPETGGGVIWVRGYCARILDPVDGGPSSSITIDLSGPPRPCTPTKPQLANSGTVHYTIGEVSVSSVALGGLAKGKFVTTGGYSGEFSMSIVGAAVGTRGLSSVLGKGTSENLLTFSGENFNIIGTLGPIAISDNFLPGSLKHVGSTNAASTWGLAIGGTRSNTTLLNVTCPK